MTGDELCNAAMQELNATLKPETESNAKALRVLMRLARVETRGKINITPGELRPKA